MCGCLPMKQNALRSAIPLVRENILYNMTLAPSRSHVDWPRTKSAMLPLSSESEALAADFPESCRAASTALAFTTDADEAFPLSLLSSVLFLEERVARKSKKSDPPLFDFELPLSAIIVVFVGGQSAAK